MKFQKFDIPLCVKVHAIKMAEQAEKKYANW